MRAAATTWMGLALVGATMLTGCATSGPAPMALHGEAGQRAQQLPVKSRFIRTGRSPVSFGDYRTTGHYGWSLPTRSVTGPDEWIGHGRERMRFGFTLQEHARTGPQVRCHSAHEFVRLGGHDGGLDLPVDPGRPLLVCEIDQASMTLWKQHDSVFGELRQPDGEVQRIVGEYRVGGWLRHIASPVGYRIIAPGGSDAMVVSVEGHGDVWLDSAVPAASRDTLAAAAAALLMVGSAQ